MNDSNSALINFRFFHISSANLLSKYLSTGHTRKKSGRKNATIITIREEISQVTGIIDEYPEINDKNTRSFPKTSGMLELKKVPSISRTYLDESGNRVQSCWRCRFGWDFAVVRDITYTPMDSSIYYKIFHTKRQCINVRFLLNLTQNQTLLRISIITLFKTHHWHVPSKSTRRENPSLWSVAQFTRDHARTKL